MRTTRRHTPATDLVERYVHAATRRLGPGSEAGSVTDAVEGVTAGHPTGRLRQPSTGQIEPETCRSDDGRPEKWAI